MTTISRSDLNWAFMYGSVVSDQLNGGAYIDQQSGKIVVVPDDLSQLDAADESRYLALPHERDLDLGRNLVMSFMREQRPDDYYEVADMFRRRGAYRKYEHYLQQHGLFEQWGQYQEDATQSALREWCADNDIEVID